ncbi:minor tail protein G [Escherichia coli]|nr:minor tail protein G [Escherichia coli]
MNEAVMQIEQEVLTTWPADAIARAGRRGVASVRDERGCSCGYGYHRSGEK